MADTPARRGRPAVAERLRDRPGALAALVALAGGLAVLVVAVEVFPYHSTNHDEAVYLQQAAMLLEGQLFLYPPVDGPFRPWFFVDAGDRLYPKYAPVPAAIFAPALALGVPRIALAAVGAAVVAGVYGVTREAFHAGDPATVGGRRVALLAAALVVVTPLFLVETALFLPYAPTAAWNLLFAFAYLRAHRLADGQPPADRPGGAGGAGDTGDRPAAGVDRRVLAWGAVAGLAVGVAFFARPYTAVLFAAPFVAHALWRLRPDGARRHERVPVDRGALARLLPTALLGLAGVAAALAYNAAVTGDPLLFPYQAFAPRDGLGFGYHEIAGYDRVYTPRLALQANARVVWALATRWAAAGPVGTALAAGGLAAVVRRGREADPRPLLVGAVGLSVVVGNVYFWGNLNVLGDLTDPTDGLIHLYGPYYHYDLLLPLSAFGARGIVAVTDTVRGRLPAALAARGVSSATAGRVAVAVLVVGWAVLGAAAVGPARDHLAENREVSRHLATAYEPVEGRSLRNGVVFLPAPYGDWLNHPFQALRNDPGYDAGPVYALRERQFAVVDAFPDRRYYRYVYRGPWAPFAGRSVDARVVPVRHVRAERVRLAATLGVPAGVDRVSIRLAGANGSAYFGVVGPPDELSFAITMADGTATLTGAAVRPVEEATVALPANGTLVVTVNVEYNAARSFTYRLAVPVKQADGAVRALTPYREVCWLPQLCGGAAAYVPGTHRPGIAVATALSAAEHAANRSRRGSLLDRRAIGHPAR